jgi:glutaredoxin
VSGARPVVTLYGRPGCHLCDDAQAIMVSLQKWLCFDLKLVNIEDDDELHRRYMFEIPVVALRGKEIAKAPISRQALTEALEAGLSPVSN